MARSAYAVVVSSASRSANARVTSAGPVDEPFSGTLWSAVNAAVTAYAAALVAVDAATATLVADAASPTQAHVTTLNTALGTLDTASAALTTAWAAFVAPAGTVVASFDDSKTTLQKAIALAELKRRIVGQE